MSIEQYDGAQLDETAQAGAEIVLSGDPEAGSGLVYQQAEAEQYAIAFLSKVIRLRGVRIDREQFLTQELRTLGLSDAQIGQAIASTPVQAAVGLKDLDALALIGVKVTKDSFAKTVTKVVPVLSGAISGGMTLVMLKSQADRLHTHLRELPPPRADAAAYTAAALVSTQRT